MEIIQKKRHYRYKAMFMHWDSIWIETVTFSWVAKGYKIGNFFSRKENSAVHSSRAHGQSKLVS